MKYSPTKKIAQPEHIMRQSMTSASSSTQSQLFKTMTSPRIRKMGRQTIYSQLFENPVLAKKIYQPVLTSRRNANRQQKTTYNFLESEEQPIQREEIRFFSPQRTLRSNPKNAQQFDIIGIDPNQELSPNGTEICIKKLNNLKNQETPDKEPDPLKTHIRTMKQERTDPISYATKEDLLKEAMRSSSIEKEKRVEGYANSNLMKETLTYQDNDVCYGIVNIKDVTRSTSQKPDFREARQNTWKTIPSPKKYTKGKQTYYLE